MLPLKLQDATVEVERLGELFLTNREQQVTTDRQRNAVREALTALRKRHGERKAFVRSSTCSFQRCASPDAAALLEQEASRLEARMTELRAAQKQLLVQLADKGATPEGLEDGMLRALLHLRG